MQGFLQVTEFPLIFTQISLKFLSNSRRNNGRKPILVFDLMALVQIINNDRLDILYGREHIKNSKLIENLLQKLSEIAKLVFFQDGPVVKQKFETWLKRQDDRYIQSLRIIDDVNNKVPLKKILEKWKGNFPTITSGLESIERLSKTYGKRIVTVTT